MVKFFKWLFTRETEVTEPEKVGKELDKQILCDMLNDGLYGNIDFNLFDILVHKELGLPHEDFDKIVEQYKQYLEGK